MSARAARPNGIGPRPIARPSILSLLLLLPLLSLLATAGGCRNHRGSGEAPGGGAGAVAALPVVVLHAGAREIPVRVELARTDDEHARGLMFRNHLDADAGMLFIFPRPGPRTFWMKNTLIPLDMIFIGRDRRIVGIVEEAVPETETARRVDGDSQYVLEIGGGLSRRLGIAPGSQVDFRNITAE